MRRCCICGATLFGDELKSCVNCPECAEQLEFTLSANTLLARAPARCGAKRSPDVSVAGLTLRLPSSRDLANIVVGI